MVLALSVVFVCFTAFAMYQLVDHFYEDDDSIMDDFGTYGHSIVTLLDSLSLDLNFSVSPALHPRLSMMLFSF